MLDFLLYNSSNITRIVEISAAVSGLFYFKKYKSTVVKYFIIYLVLIAFLDFANTYVYLVEPDGLLSNLLGTRFEKNHWLSNIYWNIGAILFFVFFFRKILKTKLFLNILTYSGCTFLIYAIINILLNWDKFFNQFFISIAVFGAIVIFTCAIFYFVEILLSDEILVFNKSINFYISATVFIWWLVITPLSFYDVYFRYEINVGFYDRNFRILRRIVYLFSNIFMYMTFAFAFPWCKPESVDSYKN